MGIPGLVAHCISKCSIDSRKRMWENVVVSGGVSMTTGFCERLLQELEILRHRTGYRTSPPPPPPPTTTIFFLISNSRRISTASGERVVRARGFSFQFSPSGAFDGSHAMP